MDLKFFEKTAADVRVGVVKAVAAAGSGHPGGSLSAADIVTALYFKEMNIDPENPKMEERDKFILSKGHAGPVQYAALALRGFFPKEEVLGLRKLGGKFQGHPDMEKVPGIEMSTGSLGQGFAVAAGMAMANKLDGNPGRVYVLIGDGELQEGMIWETAMSAPNYKLDNLVAIIDWNGLQIDGRNEDVMNVSPVSYTHLEEIIGNILKNYGGTLVLDADGLNTIARNDMVGEVKSTSADVVITPHEGEASRLLGIGLDELRSMGRTEAALALSEKFSAVSVLKGAGSIVATAGGETYINSTGNPGMATGGSGDVLTGVIASLAGQGLPAEDAAKAGVFLHGLAGDIAANELSQHGLMAGDIARHIGYAVKTVTGE